MNGSNRSIDEDQYSKPTSTFITRTICYRTCLIILDILQLQSQSRYTNSAHSEIMFHVCCLIKN